MSKIAEQKALEAYPPHYQQLAGNGYYDMSLERRESYAKGYDQAMQDFVEKAEKWIRYEWSNKIAADLMFNSFQKYLQDESENQTHK